MEKIQATMIFEILGRPAEHIKTALASLVDKIGAEKGIKVIEKTIHEPTEVKESKDLYTTFAEVSVEFDSLANYFGTIFTYMPANIEIISPVKFDISNLDLNELGNKLIARLHEYDSITKKFIYERNFLLKKLNEVAPHLFKEKFQPKKLEEQVNKEGDMSGNLGSIHKEGDTSIDNKTEKKAKKPKK